MNITCLCPACETTLHAALREDLPALACPHCAGEIPIDRGALEGGRLTRCPLCPSHELFIRKDFPQRLGVGIVVVGLGGFLILNYFHQMMAAYAVLFGTALLDAGLYLFMGSLLECYRCHAQFRGVPVDNHGSFNLETHERHRQQRIRLERAHETSVAEPPSA